MYKEPVATEPVAKLTKRSPVSLDMYENIKCIINMINIELLKLMWPRCNARAFF